MQDTGVLRGGGTPKHSDPGAIGKPEVLRIAELLGIKRREAIGLLIDF